MQQLSYLFPQLFAKLCSASACLPNSLLGMIRDENIKFLMKILVLFHHNYKITAEVNEIIAKYCLQQTFRIICKTKLFWSTIKGWSE